MASEAELPSRPHGHVETMNAGRSLGAGVGAMILLACILVMASPASAACGDGCVIDERGSETCQGASWCYWCFCTSFCFIWPNGNISNECDDYSIQCVGCLQLDPNPSALDDAGQPAVLAELSSSTRIVPRAQGRALDRKSASGPAEEGVSAETSTAAPYDSVEPQGHTEQVWRVVAVTRG